MSCLNNNETSSFHLHLLSNLIDIQKYPFSKLVIEHNITHREYMDLFNMLQQLELEYNMQKEEGFLDFTALLVHFAGMLNEKMDPDKTIYALKKEGYYPSLLTAFIDIIERKR